MTRTAPTRVLLVDDHAFVRAAVRQAVAAPDLDIVGEAATVDEALVLTERLHPDLVLLDLDLPGRSGFDFLVEARDRFPATHALVLTVSAADSDLVEAVRLGAVGYITKDVRPEEIQQTVRAAMRGDHPMPGPLAAAAISNLAAGGAGRVDRASAIGRLTDRELEVLALISEGRTDRQAAETLGIATRTVETHVRSILRRLPARNRAEASRIYRGDGSTPDEGSAAG